MIFYVVKTIKKHYKLIYKDIVFFKDYNSFEKNFKAEKRKHKNINIFIKERKRHEKETGRKFIPVLKFRRI